MLCVLGCYNIICAAFSVENGIHLGGPVFMPCWSWCCSEGTYCTYICASVRYSLFGVLELANECSPTGGGQLVRVVGCTHVMRCTVCTTMNRDTTVLGRHAKRGLHSEHVRTPNYVCT